MINELSSDITHSVHEPLYLGDSVYFVFDGCQIKLYLDNGTGVHQDTIYLEPDVANNLAEKIIEIETFRQSPRILKLKGDIV